MGMLSQEGNHNKSSCFSFIHKSERSSNNSSKNTLIRKFNLDLNNQHASTKLNILGYTGHSMQQCVMSNAMLAKQSILNTLNNLLRNGIGLY